MSSIRPGQRLAHYEIVEKIGEGGMGEVFRARDQRLDRDVALKILPAEVAANPSRRARFEREAKAVAALNHPNIVTLYSIEETEGVLFMTMELVDGVTLAEVLRRETSNGSGLSPVRFLELAVPIVDAIRAAHDRGITHRDLKPQNVIIAPDGRPKILDFGLSRHQASGDAPSESDPTDLKTAEGVVMGTVSYMSPEQALGDEVDHRSDIFSIGIVFYELITGCRPFAGGTQTRIIDDLLHRQPDPIGASSDPFAGEIARIIGKCMQKDRERRYQSASELFIDLDNLGHGVMSAAPLLPPSRMSATRSSRQVAVAAIALIAVIVTIALLIGSRGDPEEQVATEERLEKRKTIAVLPFRNLSTDESNAFFAQGIHEDLMTKLASLEDLQVMSRTSIGRFADHEGDLRELGRRLDARYLVEGSVRREEDQVRITASLVDTTTGETLWAETYDREMGSVFAMQSAIAQQIASTLQARISPIEQRNLDSVPTVVVAAYDQFLKARSILNRSRVSPDELQAALGHLEAATKADPQFAQGWAMLSRARSDRVRLLRELDDRETEAAEAARGAREALDRARALEPNAVPTLRAEGYYFDTVEDDIVKALRSYDRAVEVDPNDPETLMLQSFLYVQLGQLGEATATLERAYELDRSNGLLTYGLTYAYETTRQYQKMVPFLKRLLELEPDKTHYGVQAAYFQFLADGTLSSFHALEKALETVEKTDRCDLRSVQNTEMVVALVNDDFDTYARNWEGKWEQHHRGHGNWSCPAQINDEVNHAHLLVQQGEREMAETVLAKARNHTARPYTELTVCIFDREAFMPKIDYMDGNRELARKRFDESVGKIMQNETFPRGAVERAVLLETADLVAPDRVYSLYREIVNRPVSLLGLEVVCANPWTYPNLLEDPRFIAEVRADGRFVEFLESQGILR